jgi:enoyl-CoA hydratase/carnithine racemase
VVAPGALRDESLRLARKISESSRTVVGIGKAAFYAQADLRRAEAYAYAKEVMARNALEDDAREGIGAFLAKRAPHWRP